MHIFSALHELTHIDFYVAWGQFDALVFQKTSEVVVHVWEDHVYRDR